MKSAVITGASSGMGRRFAETCDNYGPFDEVWVIARRADRLADRIREAFRNKRIPFLVINTTNQVFPVLPTEAIARFAAEFGFEEWQIMDAEHTAIRFCTSWATPDSAVDELVAYIENKL